MASLSQAKTLGGVGGILVFIPGVSLLGWILILLATKEISESVHDKTIFDDALLAGITAIIGAIVFVFALVGFFTLPRVGLVFFPFILVLGAFWIFAIISAYFLKQSYDKISQRLNIGAFSSAGLLYLIGAVLTIVLVGFLIVLIALIFQIVAYFSIQDVPPTPGWSQPASQSFVQPPPPAQPSAGSPAQSTTAPATRFCYVCGARLATSIVFCPNCGTKQP